MSNTILSTRHAVKTSNQNMPTQFLAMAIPVNLVAGQTDSLDLTNAINTRQIDQVQCMFIDNGSSLGPLTIVFSSSNQRIIIPSFSQAYVPVLSVNDPVLTFNGFRARCRGHVATAQYADASSDMERVDPVKCGGWNGASFTFACDEGSHVISTDAGQSEPSIHDDKIAAHGRRMDQSHWRCGVNRRP